VRALPAPSCRKENMAWVNNNKKNARFNPNRRDDRLMMSQVTSRREHKQRKQDDKPDMELVSTEPDHVLSMGDETRLDWLQMALMQAGLGKLKVEAICTVLTNPLFGPADGPTRKSLKALVLGNLHLFGAKQKRAVQEAVAAWRAPEGGEPRERQDADREGAKSDTRCDRGRSPPASRANRGKNDRGGERSSSSSSSSGRRGAQRRDGGGSGADRKRSRRRGERSKSGARKGRSASARRSPSRSRATKKQQQRSSPSRSPSRKKRKRR